MKPKKKNEKPKAVKVSAEAEAKLAAQKAEEAREKIAAARNLQPGTVIGGNPDLWVYYFATTKGPEGARYKLKLDGEQMIGFSDGALYRCPKEIADERAQERAVKYKGF
jgi:hypothetical protein